MNLFQIEQELARLCVMANNTSEFLEKKLDLLQGDTPRENDPPPPLPQGVLDKISMRLTLLERTLQRNISYIGELENLIGWPEEGRAMETYPGPVKNPTPRGLRYEGAQVPF